MTAPVSTSGFPVQHDGVEERPRLSRIHADQCRAHTSPSRRATDRVAWTDTTAWVDLDGAIVTDGYYLIDTGSFKWSMGLAPFAWPSAEIADDDFGPVAARKDDGLLLYRAPTAEDDPWSEADFVSRAGQLAHHLTGLNAAHVTAEVDVADARRRRLALTLGLLVVMLGGILGMVVDVYSEEILRSTWASIAGIQVVFMLFQTLVVGRRGLAARS